MNGLYADIGIINIMPRLGLCRMDIVGAENIWRLDWYCRHKLAGLFWIGRVGCSIMEEPGNDKQRNN
jgi:hypothetical protein